MRKLGMMMAMATMFAGMSGMDMPRLPRERQRPRKLTPEQEEKELEVRQEKFLLDLEKKNQERKKDFPKWKEYEVYGLMIIACNPKNAYRDINILMQSNGIAVKD